MLRQAFLFFVHGSYSEPDIYTMDVGGWPNRENSDGHSPKLNNVGSQPSNGKMGHCGQFLKDPVHVTLLWAWFLQAYIRIL